MALILAIYGSEDANTYVLEVDADLYHAARLHNDAWLTADSPTKEAALQWATRLLDTNTTWKGQRATIDQKLDWPRFGVTDKDGYYIDTQIIPVELENATSELAFWLIKSDRLEASASPDGFSKVKVDVIEVEFDSDDRQKEIPDVVSVMIAEFGIVVDSQSKSGIVDLHRV